MHRTLVTISMILGFTSAAVAEVSAEWVEKWRRDWITEGLNSLEALVTGDGQVGDFLYGAQPGLADLCMVPQLYNAQRFGCDLSGCPTLVAVNERCLKVDAFAAAAPARQADAV